MSDSSCCIVVHLVSSDNYMIHKINPSNLVILSLTGSRSSAKLERLERKKILHENQASPALEELARTRKCESN